MNRLVSCVVCDLLSECRVFVAVDSPLCTCFIFAIVALCPSDSLWRFKVKWSIVLQPSAMKGEWAPAKVGYCMHHVHIILSVEVSVSSSRVWFNLTHGNSSVHLLSKLQTRFWWSYSRPLARFSSVVCFFFLLGGEPIPKRHMIEEDKIRQYDWPAVNPLHRELTAGVIQNRYGSL